MDGIKKILILRSAIRRVSKDAWASIQPDAGATAGVGFS
jgi:hypothetical protein